MPHTHDTSFVLNQATGFDNDDQPGIAQPLSMSEIEDLLYDDQRPASERLERLRDYREELVSRQASDFAEHDQKALLDQVDIAIDRLARAQGEFEDTGYDGTLAMDMDPADHADILALDDDARIDLVEREEASLDEARLS